MTTTRSKKTLPFEIRGSRVHGRGAFATRRIRKGARVIEYVGERIDGDEADARYDDESMEHHHTFLFEVGKDSFIDAAHNGNEARFINHSCGPNCAAYQEGERIFIEATQNIQPGIELNYDYDLGPVDDYPARWRELYACRCGADNCRGTILKPPKRKKRKKARGRAKRR